ncbi:MAG: hypothetical protein IMZ47_08525 [Firmicutes bacterium]|nr:hypothetical protein [Bacillota bacterium]
MLLEEKINNLKKEIINYANLVETMIEKSIRGLMKKDKVLLNEVIEKDEHQANTL